jgi:hypothetical protein
VKPIVTRVGRAEDGDNAFCGYAVNAELAGTTSWASAFSLAIGGPLLDDARAALVTDIAVCSLAADPRIWPLKMARLVAAYGVTLPAVAVGHLALEGAVVGAEPTGKAAETLVAWGERLGPDPSQDKIGELLDELLSRGRAAGFGVAFRALDERVAGIRRCLEKRGRTNGRYWRLLDALDGRMRERRKVQLNLAMASAAALLDVGFTPKQIRLWMSAYLDLCFYANAAEEAELQSESLRVLPANCVIYVGRAPRLSPRAEAKRTLDSRAPELTDPAFR